MYAESSLMLKKLHHQKAGKPEKALNFISKLYGLEKKAKGLDAKSRHQLRQEEAKPILDEFKQWLDSQNVLPKGLLGKAITYTQNQWPKLLTYLEDGDISIDNNVTERDIRPFTTGRKIDVLNFGRRSKGECKLV